MRLALCASRVRKEKTMQVVIIGGSAAAISAVEAIRGPKTIKASDGNRYAYDRLLIATGGKPIIPPIPGIDKEGVSPLKTMEDAERVYQLEGTKAIVIGAGSIGVESSIS